MPDQSPARFNEYNEVDIRKTSDGTRVCKECKLNDDQDLVIATIENVINHIKHHQRYKHKMWRSTLSDALLEKEIRDRTAYSVDVYTAIQNNGDGSATVRFFKDLEDAKKFDNNMDEGWGEDCSDSTILHFDKNGILINADQVIEEDD